MKLADISGTKRRISES